MKHTVVFVASPWSGGPKGYRQYLKKAVLDSLDRGEVPIASHGFYPNYLDDTTPLERKIGLTCGLELLRRSDELAVYADHGMTPGMEVEVQLAVRHRIPITFRYIMVKGPKHGS